MGELLKIDINENQEPVVIGRDLYNALEVESNYTTWFNRMCEYGFIEGIDFFPILEESTGGRPSVNHTIKLDMAKEIAMLQRSEPGKKVRQYFIKIEKDFNSPEKVMARALKIANNQILELTTSNRHLEEQIEVQKPKVVFADSVSASRTSILVGELAKIIKQNGYDIGQNRLFKWLRENNYLISRRGTDFNLPTQKSMDLGLFEITETSITHSDGRISVKPTPKVTGKGQIYFINKFSKELVKC